MADSLRLYLRYIGVSIRGQMQYRASFIMLSVGHLLITGIEFLGIWVLFDRFGSVRGWTLAEVALLYGMANISFSIADALCRGFDRLSDLVRSGEFDRILLRPRTTTLQLLGQELILFRVGRLAQGLAVLLWAVHTLDVAWSPWKAMLVIAGIGSGACIFMGIFILQGVLSFFTVESLEIVNTVSYGGVEAVQLPLSIYRPWFQRFFTFIIPLACLNYFPGLAILERADSLGTPAVFHWISPAIGVIFLIACLQVWKLGVRRYASTGS